MSTEPLPILTPLLSIKEAARQTGIPVSSLYSAVATGQLKALKFGKRIRLRSSDITAWIDSHASEEPQPSTVVGRDAGYRWRR